MPELRSFRTSDICSSSEASLRKDMKCVAVILKTSELPILPTDVHPVTSTKNSTDCSSVNKNQRNLRGESDLFFFTPVLTLWGGGHISGQVLR